MRYLMGGLASIISILSVITLTTLAMVGATIVERQDTAFILSLATSLVICINVTYTVMSIWWWMDNDKVS